jgi:hypothetical protein
MILNEEKTEVLGKDNVLVLFYPLEMAHGLGRCLLRFSGHVFEVHRGPIYVKLNNIL